MPSPVGSQSAPATGSPPKQNWQLPVGVASVFIGILISLQFRVQTVNHEPNKKEAIALVKNLEIERDKLKEELQTTRARQAEIEQKLGSGEGKTKELAARVQEARVQAGLLSMKGPGLIVKLTDSNRRSNPDEDPYFFIVHDVDLQALVNELWSAGAEAISINDQRLIHRTSIRCVGPTVLVNTVRMAAPYVVKAIGPKDDMDTGLKMQGGWWESLAMLIRNGGEVRMIKSDEITVPGYQGSLNLRFAVPIVEGGP